MIVSLKINGEVITRKVNAYVIHRELSQYVGEGKKMCDNCSNLLNCSHRSVNRSFIKRAVQLGDAEAYVTECDNYSPLSNVFSLDTRKLATLVPSTDEEIIRRYGDVYSASIAHPTVKSYISHMK